MLTWTGDPFVFRPLFLPSRCRDVRIERARDVHPAGWVLIGLLALGAGWAFGKMADRLLFEVPRQYPADLRECPGGSGLRGMGGDVRNAANVADAWRSRPAAGSHSSTRTP